jgi:ABC-type lipoprotein export system ATPase subunit
MIQSKDIKKSYVGEAEEVRALDGITLSIRPGEVVSVMGPSGSGKSTLLNVLGCLDTFDTGTLSLNGKDISRFRVEELADFRNRNIGFVFQMHFLLPEFSALENVMIPLLIRRESRTAAKKRAVEMIDRFGLGARASHRPAEMSGGECQRIAVARALVGEPSLVLADEPTGNLDSVNSKLLADILLEEARKRGTTIVIVTHDASIAALTERTVSLLDGKIKEDHIRTGA